VVVVRVQRCSGDERGKSLVKAVVKREEGVVVVRVRRGSGERKDVVVVRY
jgi:ribosomal protein L15E